MQIRFDGKDVLVTGAGRGNGRAIAQGFAAAGALVRVADIDPEGAARTVRDIQAKGGSATAHVLDVADRAAMAHFAADIAQMGRGIDVLVNNAGIYLRTGLGDASVDADWDTTLAVNLTGMFNVTRAFAGQLRANQGAVVNIASLQSFVGRPSSLAYTASKHGVAGLTRALAVELSPAGVRVNALAPGVIATAMTEVTRADPARLQPFLDHTPMGRCGEPEELVGPALFLASAQASFITGAVLPVDGGFLAY